MEKLGKAVGAALILSVAMAFIVLQAMNPCGPEFSPCPVPHEKLEGLSEQLKAITAEVPPK